MIGIGFILNAQTRARQFLTHRVSDFAAAPSCGAKLPCNKTAFTSNMSRFLYLHQSRLLIMGLGLELSPAISAVVYVVCMLRIVPDFLDAGTPNGRRQRRIHGLQPSEGLGVAG